MKKYGYGIYEAVNGRPTVKALFRGNLEIVFEGINMQECKQYCDRIGMFMITAEEWTHKLHRWTWLNPGCPYESTLDIFIRKVY